MKDEIFEQLKAGPTSLTQLWQHFPGHTFIEVQVMVEELVREGRVDFKFGREIVYFVKGD